jgi:5-methylcytosine-specific restriction endonuclease McrA
MSDKRKYSDRAEYLKKAVSKRRKLLKEKAISYLGGKCTSCGYSKCADALEFHHIDPTQKDFGISYKGVTRSWEKIKNELDKCMLVCSNCHKEIHADLVAASSGNRS